MARWPQWEATLLAMEPCRDAASLTPSKSNQKFAPIDRVAKSWSASVS